MKRHLLLLGVLLTHCASHPAATTDQRTDPPGQGTEALALPTAEGLPRFEAHWRKRTPDDVSARILALGSIVARGAALSVDQARAAVNATAGKRHGSFRPFTQKPGLAVKYDRTFDDLRVSDTELRNETGGPDVGEAQARAVLASTLGQLAGQGLIDTGRSPLERASLSHTRFGMGTEKGIASEEIVEYNFTIQRQINGIDFANAGVSVSVHRSGNISSIRIGGAEIDSVVAAGKEQPLTALSAVKRNLDDTALRARFAKDSPNAEVLWAKTMYVRADANDGAIEPRYVVSFSVVANHEGQKVYSRAMVRGYSLEDEGDVILLSDPPKPNVVSDRPRPAQPQ
jgi:hypothetical protein